MLKELRDICKLCRDVYQRTHTTDKLGVIEVQAIKCERMGTYVCAYIAKNHIYIAVRGSASLRDWISNTKAVFRARWFGIRCHRGFAQAADSVLAGVMSVIDARPGVDVTFTGHSRGGAVALLLAIATQSMAGPMTARKLRVITYGQPRVSTKSYINRAFSGEYIRVQNGSDAVPRQPKIGYSHAGRLIYIPNRRDEILDDPGMLKRFRDRLFTFHRRLSDHTANDYVRELRKEWESSL